MIKTSLFFFLFLTLFLTLTPLVIASSSYSNHVIQAAFSSTTPSKTTFQTQKDVYDCRSIHNHRRMQTTTAAAAVKNDGDIFFQYTESCCDDVNRVEKQSKMNYVILEYHNNNNKNNLREEAKNNDKFNKNNNNNIDTNHLHSSISSSSILLLLSLLLLLHPQPSPALDLPHVDIPSLNIPLPIPDARYFLAGGLCAAASHGITTPIDVVKTRMQAEPTVYASGLVSAASTIVKKDGVKVLLGGLGPTVVGYGLEGSMKFGLYESLKPIVAGVFAGSGGVEGNQTLSYLVASIVAGAVASLLLCPMERVRIKLVTDPTFATGLITGLPQLIEEEGFFSIFSGMPAMLSKQVPYTITKQVSFDIFASFLYTFAFTNYALTTTQVKAEVSVLAAFLASILSCITSHPGDVILTRTYKGSSGSDDDDDDENKGRQLKNNGFTTVVSELYSENGINGFFTGLSARFLHVGAIITSQLVLYDVIKQLLGLPATGSH